MSEQNIKQEKKMSTDDITIGEARRKIAEADELREALGMTEQASRATPEDSPYAPGTAWVWRCVTHYTVGVVAGMRGASIVLEPGACWVADTGRYNEFLRDGWPAASEVEPHPDGCVSVVERGAVVDAQSWPHGPGRKVIG